MIYKNKIKIIPIILVSIILIPQIAIASWWNPFTWKIFSKKINITEQLENKVEQDNIEKPKETENKTGTLDEYLKSLDNNSPQKETKKVESNTTANKQNTLQEYQELLSLLESDKNNFLLISKSYEENKNKSIELVNSSKNKWLDLVDSLILSNNDQSKKDYLSSLKTNITSNSNDATKKITETYDELLRITLTNVVDNKKHIDEINSYESNLKECISTKSSTGCQNIPYIKSRHVLFLSTLDRGLEYLEKANNLTSSIIRDFLSSTEDDYLFHLKIIDINTLQESKPIQINPIIDYKAPSDLTCKTEASGGLFNKTYKTTCKTDTRTPKEICESQIAIWASSGAQYGLPRPTCDK